MRYRIEVRVYGRVVEELETDDYRRARAFYRLHNEWDDRWTQLYIDGKTGSKAWMDREMHTGLDAIRDVIWREVQQKKRRRKSGGGPDEA